MMSKTALNNIRNDVVKVTVMSVVSGYLSGKDLMSQEWQMNLAYTLLGFALYELVVSKHLTEDKLKEHTDLVRDMAKTATMLVTVRVLSTQNVESLSDSNWLMSTGMVLAGLAVYHMVTKQLFDNSDKEGDWKQVSDDWVKVGTKLLVAHYLSGGDVTNNKFLQNTTNKIVGFNLGSLVDYVN